MLAGQHTDMTILYKYRVCPCHEELSKNITIIKVDKDEFSSHHTNITILQYSNEIRVVVSTAAYILMFEKTGHKASLNTHRYFLLSYDLCL